MTAGPIDHRLDEAISMREAGRTEEARQLLLTLVDEAPDDPRVNLQCAWAHDKLGLEHEAVPFYETALERGLEGDDLRSALLGLGSTYRALGDYEKALTTLSRGVERFPGDRSFQVFQAMALYNNDRPKEACELLLTVVSETSGDERIVAFRPAIDIYAADLDRTWS